MRSLAIVGAALIVMFSAIHAEAIATLHIGPGYGDPCATGCGGDPNPLPDGSGLSIYQNSGGASVPALVDLLLVLALPNNSGGFLTSIENMTSYNPYVSPPPTVPGSTSGASAFAYYGAWTSSDADLYAFLGRLGNSSVNFGNFAATESGLSVTATQFGIYTFTITGISLGPKGLLDIDFSTDLPYGTIALAWGAANGKYYETPYTEAGAVVPEPSTLLLLGSGLLGLGGFAWRRTRKG